MYKTTIWLLSLLLSIIICSQVQAQNPYDYRLIEGMWEMDKFLKGETYDKLKVVKYMYFILGVAEGIEAGANLTGSTDALPYKLPEGGIPLVHLSAVATAYLLDHPKQHHVPSETLVIWALTKEYPR